MNITETVVIERDVDAVYGAFADLVGWTSVLPDVLDVQLLYDDGYNQEFTMTVDRAAGPETIRGIRYCRPPTELELFQPQPPPLLRSMQGLWRFDGVPGGPTTVVATRSFELPWSGDGEPSRAHETAFAAKLSAVLRTNLDLFKDALEGDGTD